MSRLKWRINRLSLMSPLEIGYRIKEEIRKKYERLFTGDFSPNISSIEKNINWYFDVQKKEIISGFIKDENIWEEDKEFDLLKHKFSFFSFNKKYLDETINWHRDYKNDKEAPLRYCKDIDYREFAEVGDIKYIWEINRLGHLISLAKTYYLTGKEEYKIEVNRQINSWIDTNPYMRGVNWGSALELAIRLISWSWVWFFIGDLEKSFRAKWLTCIYKHCNFICRNFSSFSSANNHLIGEAAGLFIASIVWPFEGKSKRWQKKSYKVLIEEIEKQNYEDGVNKEQAISYQQFVLDFFILAGLLGEKNRITFPQKYWQLVEKMIEFIASVMDKNGNVPNIGDSDDGYAVILSDNKNFNPYQSLLTTGAILFKRGYLKSKAGQFDEKSFWLFGVDGVEQFNALNEEKFTPVKTFEKGGYYVLNVLDDTEGEIKAVFDCGPLGYLSIAAHGHADVLGFTLSVGGKKFLIDPGTYTYHKQREWRYYFIGTAAHNTIRIDGQNQSVIAGNFMWLRKAQAKLLKWESNDEYDLVEGEHDGYMRLKDSVKHQREMFLDKKKRVFKVIDRIKAKKTHYIEQFFHFSKECSIYKLRTGEWEIKNNDTSIYMKLDGKLNTKIFHGSVNPILGWQSEGFDLKTPASTMVNSVEHEGPCELKTLIVINTRGEKNEN